MNKPLKTILIIVGILALLGAAIYYFKKPSNQVIDKNTVLVDQKTNKTEHGVNQETLVTYDPNLISHLKDSLKDQLIKEAGITKPQTLIKWKTEYIETDTDGEIKDSLSRRIDELIAENRNNNPNFEALKQALYTKNFPYTINTKYRKESGYFNLNGKVHSDSLKIFSEPTLLLGYKTGFLKRPKLIVTIGDKNPDIKIDSLQSIAALRVPAKGQLSIGPLFLTDGKNYSGGVGLTYRKGWFSVSAGYQLLTNKK